MLFSRFFVTLMGFMSTGAFPLASPLLGSFIESLDGREWKFSHIDRSQHDAVLAEALASRDQANMVDQTMTEMAKGGDLKTHILQLVHDPNLAKDLLALVNQPGFPERVLSMLRDKSFLGKLYKLLGDDDFITQIADAFTNRIFLVQLTILVQNNDIWHGIGGILSEHSILVSLQEALGPDWDIGGLLGQQVGRASVTKLIVNVFAGNPFTAPFRGIVATILNDDPIQEKVKKVFVNDLDFAGALTGVFQDRDFVSHVCSLAHFPQELINAINDAFHSNNFAASAETIFGPKTRGQITGYLGNDDFPHFLRKFLGMMSLGPDGSFNHIILSYFQDGKVFENLGALLLHQDFTAQMTNWASAALDGKMSAPDLLAVLMNSGSMIMAILVAIKVPPGFIKLAFMVVVEGNVIPFLQKIMQGLMQ